MYNLRNVVLTRKLGVIQIYLNSGEVFPATLILLSPNVVSNIKVSSNYFNILFISTDSQKLKTIHNGILHSFFTNDIFPKKLSIQSACYKNCSLNFGDRIGVDFFRRSQYIDVSGISIGKGFAGVIKRHGFKGLEATHGVSVSHRSHGSTGQCQDPGRVFKGKKMAGHLGNKRVTIRNLKILDIDYDLGILVVKGIIPGSRNLYLRIKDSSNK